MFDKRLHLFMKKVYCSLEILVFGANQGVLAYVLKRERAVPANNIDFALEICVNERGGRAARCMGRVPVAHLLASEARHAPPGVHVSARAVRVPRPL